MERRGIRLGIVALCTVERGAGATPQEGAFVFGLQHSLLFARDHFPSAKPAVYPTTAGRGESGLDSSGQTGMGVGATLLFIQSGVRQLKAFGLVRFEGGRFTMATF